VEVAAVDERDLDWRTPQLRDRLEAAESSADNDDMTFPRSVGVRSDQNPIPSLRWGRGERRDSCVHHSASRRQRCRDVIRGTDGQRLQAEMILRRADWYGTRAGY
jgi:hypothetical protein